MQILLFFATILCLTSATKAPNIRDLLNKAKATYEDLTAIVNALEGDSFGNVGIISNSSTPFSDNITSATQATNIRALINKAKETYEALKVIVNALEGDSFGNVGVISNSSAPFSDNITPATQAPNTAPATKAPNTAPATQAPTTAQATQAPNTTPATQAPNTTPATPAPNTAPATQAPNTAPATQAPNTVPATQAPNTAPAKQAPNTRVLINKATAGLAAGNAIIKVLRDSSGNLGVISKHITPFLDAIGAIISFVNMFTPYTSRELQFMQRKFQEMEDNFNRIYVHVDKLAKLVTKTSLNAQYGHDETRILGMWDELQLLRSKLSSNSRYFNQHKNDFIEHYKSYRGHNSLDHIWSGMARNTVLSSSIPPNVMSYLSNHRKNVLRLLKSVIGLILKGVEVELWYYKLSGSDALYNTRKTVWEGRIKRVPNLMLGFDKEVSKKWKEQLGKDIDAKLAELSGWSHSSFADNLYDFLDKKYDWRHWHVVAYDPLYGGDLHWGYQAGGYSRYRKHGRNLRVSSVDKEKKSTFDKWHANHLLYITRTRSCVGAAWMNPTICSDFTAKQIFNALPYEMRNGHTYAGVAVIIKTRSRSWGRTTNTDIAIRAPSSRSIDRVNHNFKLYAFG